MTPARAMASALLAVLVCACSARWSDAPANIAPVEVIDAHTAEATPPSDTRPSVQQPTVAPKPATPEIVDSRKGREEGEPSDRKSAKKKPRAEDRPPEPEAPPDPAIARRERALRSLRRPFVALQNIVMQSTDDEKSSHATFYMFPGVGYRLHLRGPLDLTLLDVSVRCGNYRYAVPLKLRRFEGPLRDAATTVGHFPVEALYALFDPSVHGTWNQDTFVADHGALVAVLHPTLDAFTAWRINDAYKRAIDVRIDAFAKDSEGYLLPKRMVLDLPDGRRVILDAEQFLQNVPAIDVAIPDIRCE